MRVANRTQRGLRQRIVLAAGTILQTRYARVMTDLRWVFLACSLVACGGRAVDDGALATGGEPAGGSTSFAGASSGGASPVGGSTSFAGASSGGASSVGGSSASGGSSIGGSAACLNSGKPPASPITFLFESNQGVWIHYGCDIDYTLSKVCKPENLGFQTQTYCGSLCEAADRGCNTCGACPDGTVQIGHLEPSRKTTTSTTWDGYAYFAGISSSGCACYSRQPAGSGSYTITITGYLSSDDALARRNGFPFSTTFEYPPPDGVVHVPLDFTGL